MTTIAVLLSLVLGAPLTADQNAPAVAKGTGRITGRVVSLEGAQPIPYAFIRLVRWEGGLGQQRFGFTDLEGRFDFAELLAGSYQITVSADGFVTLKSRPEAAAAARAAHRAERRAAVRQGRLSLAAYRAPSKAMYSTSSAIRRRAFASRSPAWILLRDGRG